MDSVLGGEQRAVDWVEESAGRCGGGKSSASEGVLGDRAIAVDYTEKEAEQDLLPRNITRGIGKGGGEVAGIVLVVRGNGRESPWHL